MKDRADRKGSARATRRTSVTSPNVRSSQPPTLSRGRRDGGTSRHLHAEQGCDDLGAETAAVNARRRGGHDATHSGISSGPVVSIPRALRPACEADAVEAPGGRGPRRSACATASGSRRQSSWRLDLLREAASEQPQEGELRDLLRTSADGGVGPRPVDRQAKGSPQVLETSRRRPSSGYRARLSSAGTPDRLLGRLVRATKAGSYGRDGSHRTRSNSGRGARWGARCRPTPSGRTRPCRACDGSGPENVPCG